MFFFFWDFLPSSLFAAYLKPRAEEDRRIEAEEKKKQEEAARIARELAGWLRVIDTCAEIEIQI